MVERISGGGRAWIEPFPVLVLPWIRRTDELPTFHRPGAEAPVGPF